MFCGHRRGFKKTAARVAHCARPDAVFLTPAWRLSLASFFFLISCGLISRWLRTLWRPQTDQPRGAQAAEVQQLARNE